MQEVTGSSPVSPTNCRFVLKLPVLLRLHVKSVALGMRISSHRPVRVPAALPPYTPGPSGA